jgi:hypothetical protein
MQVSLKSFIYNTLCACFALAIAGFAMMPVSAATAGAIGIRGGQAYSNCNGCHDIDANCSGNASCQEASSTACISGAQDTNHENCSPDTRLCSNEGCGGVDSVCGGR